MKRSLRHLLRRCSRKGRTGLLVIVCAALPVSVFLTTSEAQEQKQPALTPSVAERFSRETNETPDFRRHVLPLLNRSGCNAAACHGAKEGQGGFQLSLFGYDLEADYKQLVEDRDPPRANWKEPDKSDILLKPSLQKDHEGGFHFDEGDWQYRLLQNWVRGRAPGESTKTAPLARLVVEPAELVLKSTDEAVPLRAIAVWADGTAEDVTALCRFQSNNEAVAEVDEEGVVSFRGSGDTQAIAFYDQMIVSVPILSPYPGNYRAMPLDGLEPIDRLIAAKQEKLRLEAADSCSDAEFLRRVSLDLTGTLPTAQRVREFLADSDLNKRARLVEELLASEEYVACWTNFLCELTGNSENQMPDPAFRREQSQQWYDWIERRVRDNVPYDEIVEGMVCGTSRSPDESYADYCRELSTNVRADGPRSYDERETLPLYWARVNTRSADNKTLSFSHVFLGVRLQCAECHKHPFDRWTKDDFDGLKAFFEPLGYRLSPEGEQVSQAFREANVPPDVRNAQGIIAKLAREGKVIPWKELTYASGSRGGSNSGTFTQGAGREADPLRILMDWLRDPSHPYMSLAFVNRVWAHYFGLGIVDPQDDLSLANPPSNRALLDYLAAGFIESGYDMKWLHRQILKSEAYQRSWQPRSSNRADARNFSHRELRRLPAEVIYDAVWLATANDQKAALRSGRRAVGPVSGMTRSEGVNRLLGELGKPDRSAVCENERSNEPSLTQAIFLQNDPEVDKMISRPDGWVASVCGRLKGVPANDLGQAKERSVEEAFLRTLSRFPTQEEHQVCLEFMENSATPENGVRGILWMLLNTKEFCINR